MSRKINMVIGIIVTILLGCGIEVGMAQNPRPKPDSVATSIKSDTTKNTNDIVVLDGEIELLEITIEAVVEKPRVSIFPKRVEPELGELELVNRSFEKELKSVPEHPMILDDRLLVPKKIENLRKQLLKKKEELGNKQS